MLYFQVTRYTVVLTSQFNKLYMMARWLYVACLITTLVRIQGELFLMLYDIMLCGYRYTSVDQVTATTVLL